MDSESAASAGQLAQAIESYLADHPAAALLEDGRVVFDMRTARYSVGESHGRCLLQFWSDERNLMRTVVEVQHRAHSLRLMTRRMGITRPQALELVPTSDRRTPTTRRLRPSATIPAAPWANASRRLPRADWRDRTGEAPLPVPAVTPL